MPATRSSRSGYGVFDGKTSRQPRSAGKPARLKAGFAVPYLISCSGKNFCCAVTFGGDAFHRFLSFIPDIVTIAAFRATESCRHNRRDTVTIDPVTPSQLRVTRS
jgi:hypothetical protein